MTCPTCRKAELNRLAGPDGHQVVLVAGPGWRAVECRTMAVIYACPACEFIGTKDQAVAGV
ncbi:MAG: hypothetical protein AB7S57_19605 [Acetobacteraceae bacterium]